MFFRSTSALVLALGCQAKPQDTAAPAPAPVTVRDATGAVIATLRPGHPCRASVAGQELIVGGPPLVAQRGAVRWTGTAGSDGTLLARDGEAIARVFAPDPHLVAVFDPHGQTALRVTLGKVAAVSNAAGERVRTLAPAGHAITADTPALTITGTSDLALAALLSAPELSPEIRMLAACQRALGGS